MDVNDDFTHTDDRGDTLTAWSNDGMHYIRTQCADDGVSVVIELSDAAGRALAAFLQGR